MRTATIMLVLGGVALGGYALQSRRNPEALDCVRTTEDRAWSFLEFSNGCNRPINAIFCQKFAMSEWLALLEGEEAGALDCRSYHVAAGDSFATIKWTNDNSSVASHMLSTSRWTVAACDAPFVPRFTRGTSFVCEA
jgi:hypothetical protein